jgi:hypothetical protein
VKVFGRKIFFKNISNRFMLFNLIISILILLFLRPDTFVDTSADQSGFLLPQKGSLFLVTNNGKSKL